MSSKRITAFTFELMIFDPCNFTKTPRQCSDLFDILPSRLETLSSHRHLAEFLGRFKVCQNSKSYNIQGLQAGFAIGEIFIL